MIKLAGHCNTPTKQALTPNPKYKPPSPRRDTSNRQGNKAQPNLIIYSQVGIPRSHKNLAKRDKALPNLINKRCTTLGY